MAHKHTDADVVDEVERLNEEAVRDAREHEPAPRRGRIEEVDEDQRVRIQGDQRRRRGNGSNGNGTLIGLGLGLATAGAAAFFFARARSEDELPSGPILSDAPDHVLRGKAQQRARNQEDGRSLVGRTVTIGKPAGELYAIWRRFERFPEFMDNVREIRRIDDKVSEWTIEAPGGATVQVKTRILEDIPNKTIAWVSEPDSQIETEGRVEFAEAPPGRGTYVRLLIRYTPPAGALGRMVAKVMQREPNVQARRDLRRFKQLMETGEVPVNASPSGRKSESPTEPRI
ncbi:SRPBCC family protein [Sphingomonas sp. LHG3406-1]|uniref:SRPBCC family protein n=1 Tax=Sphingomonas sp. LHG3406-1 TaxID=2804617 RepID=UPI002606152B|nr:SRPBCC family protein [Sphingomonas sp. LHG3406-1]